MRGDDKVSDLNFDDQLPASRESRARGCGPALLLLLLITCVVLGAASFLIYRWQTALAVQGLGLTDAAPDLGLGERLALQIRLANGIQALDNMVERPAGDVTLVISPGATADDVAAQLVDAGMIDDPELWVAFLHFHGLDRRLLAGQFTVNSQQTPRQLAFTVTQGSAQDTVISFLPGMRLEEMADYLAVVAPGAVDAADFLAIARRETPHDLSDYPFLASLSAGDSLEGFLLPDRYAVPPKAGAGYLIDQMLDNFDRQVTPEMRQAFGAQGLSLREAVIVASIVAREVLVEEERPLVASVYLNRIAATMPLQADPTAQYAAGFHPATNSWWKVPLSLADLRNNHPYNTYVIQGLPPGPIANPGLASLEAVAQPAPSDFLFFVLDCRNMAAGRHIFSVTYEEHLDNVQRCDLPE